MNLPQFRREDAVPTRTLQPNYKSYLTPLCARGKKVKEVGLAPERYFC